MLFLSLRGELLVE